MKKIIASAGLLAVGAYGVQAQAYGQAALTREETIKPWSISASLRGFYDDNYQAAHEDSGFQEESFGFEFSPAAGLRLHPSDQLSIALQYIYSLRYFEAREDEPFDHSHEFRGRLDYAMSERVSFSLEDSFVYAQEPIVVDEGAQTAFGRSQFDADALRNRAAINSVVQLTERWGLGLGYQNLWVDWENDIRSLLLDRMEHLFRIDGRWTLQPDLIALVGYNFGIVDYDSDLLARDNLSHYVYVGAEKAFTDVFRGHGRVGVRYTEYNDADEDSVNPYADLGLTYEYARGSSLSGGLRYDRSATDVAAALEQNTGILYGGLRHRITPQLTAEGTANFQYSTFEGGPTDGDTEKYLLLGAELEYAITRHWAVELGYNFDWLESDLALRSFTRNRVYAGVRASY